MIQKYSWLGELMRIAGTDRDTAREKIESVTIARLAQLFLTLAEPDQPIAPMFLMIVPSPRFDELDQMVDKIALASYIHAHSAALKLSEQEQAVETAFKDALDAQSKQAANEESARDVYFLQIAIREKRLARVKHTAQRHQCALYIQRIIKAETQRRSAIEQQN